MKAAFAVLLLLGGCTDSTDLLASDGGTGDACMNPGPPTMLGSSCAGALAAQLGRYALCSCSSLVLDRGLFTEGGSMPGGPPGGPPPIAAAGTDGSFQAGGPVQVAGTLTAGGAGASFARTSVVFGNLRSAGTIGSNALLTVGNDAFANGDVLGKVDIQGTLHIPDGFNITPGVSASDVHREPVVVPPPCNCDAGPALDPLSLTMARAASNDDPHIALNPDAFAGPNMGAMLDLPCGQYYLSQITGPGPDIKVHGHTALFVAGDIDVGVGMRVFVDPGAELDVVVAGNVSVGSGQLGGLPASAVRFWVGGKSVHFGAGATVNGTVYAPSASFSSDGDLDATGAIFGHDFQPAGDLSVRYDRLILDAGMACGAQPQPPVD
jgi:hypothetical protein